MYQDIKTREDRIGRGNSTAWWLVLVGVMFLATLYHANIIENKLSDIRAIQSEQRDAFNCLAWPDDSACN